MFLHNNNLATERLLEEYYKYDGLVIGIDFDDTLFDFHKRGLHNQINIIVDLLTKLQNLNCKLCIWTANNNKQKVVEELNKIKLSIDYYNESPIKQFNGVKPYFNVLLDDRAGLDSTYNSLCIVLKHIQEYNKLIKEN